ncbi:hypothetical protein HMPREF9622_02779 [Cutibacterium modestum HL037PA3]|uniref:DUF4143 domain-containing protein n=1 Tax=Cutibacterium modestum HL044PA1 TaxID=765109 RepID=A0ABN0C4G6_9ACTN|nr:hypothetical protein HMPREF9621_02586 [Cutibacterium modestum HL037PA2]EFS92046.1 hypothetical protein HMPREF9607_01674 [Cutibacterium modestum HL044PA1]EFT14142.1 hypothetical protein HMPREF9622_02779 [Cutibacterium modestum HL037PA3]EGG25748.1 hypothetical protein PA08_2700 [Cutibacterium modestum P08]
MGHRTHGLKSRREIDLAVELDDQRVIATEVKAAASMQLADAKHLI